MMRSPLPKLCGKKPWKGRFQIEQEVKENFLISCRFDGCWAEQEMNEDLTYSCLSGRLQIEQEVEKTFPNSCLFGSFWTEQEINETLPNECLRNGHKGQFPVCLTGVGQNMK